MVRCQTIGSCRDATLVGSFVDLNFKAVGIQARLTFRPESVNLQLELTASRTAQGIEVSRHELDYAIVPTLMLFKVQNTIKNLVGTGE